MKNKHILAVLILALSFFGSGTQAQFLDVDVTHPYYHAISMLSDEGVIKGYDIDGETLFRPLQKVNRAEALKMLMLSSKISLSDTDSSSFSDVPTTEWYFPYVQTAAEHEIVQGFADGNFHPAAQVTRAEFVKMLLVSFGFEIAPEQADEDWFDRYFLVASQYRLIPYGEDKPHESLTRGEIAELVYRAEWVASMDYELSYIFRGAGKASYYNEGFAGRSTASGEIYDPTALTAAHRTLPFGTQVKVFYEGKSIIVRINDRGPYHPDRVLDLSEEAFTYLAPVSRGVIDIDFEVVVSPNDEPVSVPEYIRESLSEENKVAGVPSIIEDALEEESNDNSGLPDAATDLGTVNHAVPTFFDGVTLRNSIPQKVELGTVLNFSGTADQSGHDKGTVFLQKIDSDGNGIGTQIQFTGELSGKNFAFPVFFLKTGTYQMGFVLDDERRSKVLPIEVIAIGEHAPLASTSRQFDTTFWVDINPDTAELELHWEGENEVLTRFTFYSRDLTKQILVPSYYDEISIPKDFFNDFRVGDEVDITMYRALSSNGSVYNRTGNWKKTQKKTFTFVAGMKETQKDSAVRMDSFSRFKHDYEPITIEGRKLSPSTRIADNFYLTKPDGFVDEKVIEWDGVYEFSVSFTPEEPGRYTIEVISDVGEVLFNRCVYVTEDLVLPAIIPAPDLVQSSLAANRNWINQFRSEHGVGYVRASGELNSFAQSYAEEMVAQNFIGHVSPIGVTFQDRVQNAGLAGEFAENIAFGTDLSLALEGLTNSGSHRKNMLNRRWERVGVGIAQNQNGEWYVVHVFGTD